MNGNNIHYMDTGFPYTVTESFMDFFDGIAHVPVNYAHAGPVHDQGSAYWSMNMHSYKFGVSGQESTSYYSPYDINNQYPRTYAGGRAWEYPPIENIEELVTTDAQSGEDDVVDANSIPEGISINENTGSSRSQESSQVVWQDAIDPDNMTYEELLDLGEAVGTESRGLSKELISLLPTSKYKLGSFFSRKRSGERCVICQMRYKRGDWQIKLPCNHVYHNECITKWLTINKICPICNIEVFGEESRH